MNVYIKETSWKKIMNYASCAYDTMKTEIGGMSVVIKDDNGDWWIKDPVIMKQEVSGGLCEIDKTELSAYYTKAALKYKKECMRFCWWHSHHTMGAFWSGTDLDTIDEYEDGDLSFALVVNLKEEYKCRISVWNPIVMHKDVELNIVKSMTKKVPKGISNEVAKHCSKPESTYSLAKYDNMRGWSVYGKQHSLFQEQADLETIKHDKFAEIYEKVYEVVDEAHSAVITGSIKYEEYSKKLKDMNVKLAESNVGININIISKNSIEDLFTIVPAQLIKVTDPEFVDEYDLMQGGYYGGY